MMSHRTAPRRRAWALGLLAAAALLCGCPTADRAVPRPQPSQGGPRPSASEPAASEEQAAARSQEQATAPSAREPQQLPAAVPEPKAEGPSAPPGESKPAAAAEEEPAKPVDLGEPLVDDLKSLVRLDLVAAVWIDRQHEQVVMLAQVCRADYPLEFFATYRDRGYEAVVACDVRPRTVHAALLALGAEPGHPVRFEPDFVPPTGTAIAIEVRWKDRQGKRQSAPAQQWVRNIQTKQALDADWVFAGSGFWRDEETGQERYMADGGDFISVLNLPGATLDLPIRSFSSLESRLFEGFVEHLPPEGTPVTMILTPKLKQPKKVKKADQTPPLPPGEG